MSDTEETFTPPASSTPTKKELERKFQQKEEEEERQMIEGCKQLTLQTVESEPFINEADFQE